MPAAQQRTPNVWVVRADGGEETQNCVNGGFTAIGWKEIGDLTDAVTRSVIGARWRLVASADDKPRTISAAIGNIARFCLEMQIGDWVITPEADIRWWRYGQVIGDYRYDPVANDGCRYHHRRDVIWQARPLYRYEFTPRFRSALGQRTVQQLRQEAEFFEQIGFLVQRR